MTKFFLAISLTLSSLSAVSQYNVIDSETKAPISYAHIKLESKSKGVIADYSGFFSLDSSFIKQDTLVISCIGYKKKIVSVETIIIKNVIELEPSHQELSEVIVSAEKLKYQIKKIGITKKPKKSGFADYAGRAKNGEEKAIWIPNDYSIRGNLKAINVFVSDLGYPDAHFRIHVYDCNPLETKPSNEMTTSNIIASGTNGNEWVKIDMSAEQILIEENGCFIGIEWFDSPKSKSHKDTIFKKGYTYSSGKEKDTTYSRIRSGNGVVLGAVYQKYRDSKNKLWYKKDNNWLNRGNMGAKFFTTHTLPNGSTFLRTPDNHYRGVLCINIDVAFQKNKIDLSFEPPKKRKLNKIEKAKIDLFKYPQSNISELFSSLIKAFENDDIIYVFKYLCVYKEDELNDILADLNTDNESVLPNEEKIKIAEYLKGIQAKIDSFSLNKVGDKHFELTIENETYNLIVDDGLWKINPYSYRIYK